ncbi:MAG: ChbG/HpnK family deacetylase [Planctomycetaceae bacterium]|nr:ChbG/HpnK family deacetylase [Planctomycetaceae bacterium]
MKRLILNADDLGFSPAVNAAVLDGVCSGILTAASLMVNMPYAEEAVEQVRTACPGLSLALHFTLTSGRPAARPKEIPLLTDARGMFHLGFSGLWKRLLSEKHRGEMLRQIETEFTAQMQVMERFTEKYALTWNHLDSHQHIHVLPGLLPFLQREAARRNLSLRIPRENFGGWLPFLRRCLTCGPQGIVKRAVLCQNLRHTEQRTGYFGILDSGKMNEAALSGIVRRLGRQHDGLETAEVNLHPSDFSLGRNATLCCSPEDAAFHRSPWRTQEFLASKSGNIRRLAEKYGVMLTGFD